jgi:hypothetical protein
MTDNNDIIINVSEDVRNELSGLFDEEEFTEEEINKLAKHVIDSLMDDVYWQTILDVIAFRKEL